MSGRRDGGQFRVRPGGSARLAAARLRRARPRPILARPPVQATPPCVPPHRRSQPPRSEGVSTPLQSRNLTQNQRDIFHLNYVPRQ